MSATIANTTSFGASARATRRLRWAVVAIHVLFVAIPVILSNPANKALGGTAAASAVVAVPVGLALLGLQLRHSLATIRGHRPRGGVWTLLALTVLVYLPLLWGFGWNWISMQALVIASALMVLRGRPAAVAVVPILVTDVILASMVASSGQPASAVASWVLYVTFALTANAAALYGSARLVRVLDELQATRTELAELAVSRERVQLARNLHDLLGQSLSAISLKGDLALRLLGRDPPAARAEIKSLTGVARDALRDVRAVTRDQHTVTLAAELEGAAALLAAAGIEPRIEVDLPGLGAATEEALAWAIREGITNVLRHSQADTCQVTARRRNGHVRLEIVNDGAGRPVDEGTGLAGVNKRAAALGGTATAGPLGDGRFRLLVELPEGAT